MQRVLVHGFTQSPASWDAVTRALPGEEVVAPTIDGDRGDFVAIAGALDSGPGEYVGYSMGGRLCLQLALDRPEVVRRLVLVSASPGIADPGERSARRDTDDELARTIERDGVDRFLEGWLAQPLFATLGPDQAGLDQRRRANTVEGLTSQLRVLGQGVQPSNWDRLGELAMPVLLVAGALDAKYVDIAHRMAEAIADVRLEVIAGAGHACHLERPDEFAHLLSSW